MMPHPLLNAQILTAFVSQWRSCLLPSANSANSQHMIYMYTNLLVQDSSLFGLLNSLHLLLVICEKAQFETLE